MDITDITTGYAERMRRLLLSEPLNELNGKKETDDNGKSIDLKGLGLLTLLYFFEQKIMRNTKTGVMELSRFLRQLTDTQFQLTDTAYEKIARKIIQTFRPSSGKKYEQLFYNWETQKEEILFFSYLKANSFDMKTNAQYYTLDDDGLELIFATKEFYSEFQLSINQLLLRKQLEKGEFKGALRQLNEMQIDVETLEDRMIKISHEMKRNIISEETFNRYAALIEDIFYRLQLENEEFDALHTFVKETKDRLSYKNTTDKEQQAYALIVEIANKLDGVHASHTKLLQQAIHLKNEALVTAQEALYYIGIYSFNFDNDVTTRIVSTPLPLEAMKGIIAPFLSVHEHKQWSLLSVFHPQQMKEEHETEQHEGFYSVHDEKSDLYKEQLQKTYRLYMEQLLLVMANQQKYTLREFIAHIEKSEFASFIENRSFYDFFLFLHQRSPIKQQEQQDEPSTTTYEKIAELLGESEFWVNELPDRIQVTTRYSIQNMQIHIQGEEDEL